MLSVSKVVCTNSAFGKKWFVSLVDASGETKIGVTETDANELISNNECRYENDKDEYGTIDKFIFN